MKIDLNEIEDLEVDGVDTGDYPDFCDAYFSSAHWVKSGIQLTDEQLEWLGEQYPELLNEMAYESLI